MYFYFIQTIFFHERTSQKQCYSSMIFFFQGRCVFLLFYSVVKFLSAVEQALTAAKPRLLPQSTFLLPMHGWAGSADPISGYFWLRYALGGQGERTVLGAPSLAVLWWRVKSLCCCTQFLLSGLVWHGALGCFVWELIPFPWSSSLPERDLALGSCIGLTPCFLVCQRNLLPSSDDWGALMASFSQGVR